MTLKISKTASAGALKLSTMIDPIATTVPIVCGADWLIAFYDMPIYGKYYKPTYIPETIYQTALCFMYVMKHTKTNFFILWTKLSGYLIKKLWPYKEKNLLCLISPLSCTIIHYNVLSTYSNLYATFPKLSSDQLYLNPLQRYRALIRYCPHKIACISLITLGSPWQCFELI